MRARGRIMPLAIVLALGCVPTDFEDLRQRAPTVALAAPADYPVRGFGTVVTAYAGTSGGQPTSRLAANAGAGAPFSVYPVVTGDRLRLDVPVLDGCTRNTPCGPGAGASLFGLPRWGSREMCLGVTSPDTGEIVVRCEDDPLRIFGIAGPGGERFGAAAASLEDHAFGRAVIGAPGGAGAVYRLPDQGGPEALDLSEAASTDEGLGSAVAVRAIDADRVLVASAAPLGAMRRVIVAIGRVAGDGSVETRVHECLESAAEGFGSTLAVGDLNGDGALDLVVGGAGVRVYDGASLPGEGTCDGSWASREIACASVGGVTCEGSDFGASLAIGDVDGDGVEDLLVGAPSASVDGVAGAGAVLVHRGTASLAELDRTVVALRASSPTANARVGASVAVARGLPGAGGVVRVEPIAGAPGVDRVYAFLCSELDGDTPASTDSARCQP